MKFSLWVTIENHKYHQQNRTLSTRKRESLNWFMKRTPLPYDLPSLLKRQV